MQDSKLMYEGAPYEERFKKGVELDRDHDTTQLKSAALSKSPHKDYLGHCFRWGFVGRYVDRKSVILDAGCGEELPLMYSLGGANPNTVPKEYVGVDMNKLPEPKRKWATVYGQSDLTEIKDELQMIHDEFNLAVSFEVYEHIAPHLSIEYLKAIRDLMSDDGVLVFSTPVYCHSFKQARNHINERTKLEVEDDLSRAGFRIVGQYGTFGNFRDIKKMLTEDELNSFQEQRAFYGDDVLGCYLSPRFPEASRNIVHICRLSEFTSQEDGCALVASVVTNQ